MSRFTKKRSVKAGLPPGTLVHISDTVSDATVIEVFEYNEKELKELRYRDDQISEFTPPSTAKANSVVWINVDGLSSLETIERICSSYNIHSLVMEDILNTDQRPKIENYDSYLYIVAKMVYYKDSSIINEQLSIILGDGYILSFGEKEGDVFNQIRERIRKDAGRIRKCGADYLAYSLLDAVVDGYFNVLEGLGDRIDELEESLLNNPSIDGLHSMRQTKRDLLYMHKSIWPLREVASWLERDGNSLIAASTQVYLRDVYDHIIQAIDTTETFRELLAGLMDVYLSSISNKMNEIMKVLTIISTIFIPLTFIAGVYGMNFKYMPELEWKFGYGSILMVMLAIAAFMVLYFKRKKWF